MDGTQGLDAHYPSFPHDQKTGCVPGIPAFDYSGWFGHGHRPNIQDPPSKEITTLYSKLAIAECRIDELQKDKAMANKMIDYLMKLNARAGNHMKRQCTPVPSVSPQYAPNTRVAQDVKDILDPVIGLLHQILRAGSFDRKPFAPSTPHKSFPSVNLLDVLDGALESKGDVKGAEVSANIPNTHWECPKVTPIAEVSQEEVTSDYREKIHAAKTDLMSFEENTPLEAPLVARFRNGRGERATPKGSSKPSHLPSSVDAHREGLDNLKSFFGESEAALSGSTQYDASQSSSNEVTSTTSSFTGSDDESNAQNHLEGMKSDPTIKAFANVSRNAPGSTKSSKSGDWSADDASDHNSTTITSTNLISAPDPAALFQPKWSPNPLGASFSGRDQTIARHKKAVTEQEHNFPDIFRYGIRFRPDPGETNVYRTILIDDLPKGLSISQLLDRIRGGEVMDAKLLDTTTINDHMTALVVFLHERHAKAFESRMRQSTQEFCGARVRVALLPTPTYPAAKNLQIAIEKHNHTRCLEVFNFPKNVTPAELKRDLRICNAMTTNRIETTKMRADGVLELRFTAIKYAGQAYGCLTTFRRYQLAEVVYAADPCAGPWDDKQSATTSQKVEDRKELGHVAAAGQDVSAVSRWKEYALDTFIENSTPVQAQVDDYKIPEDNTGRLSGVNAIADATVQRGRGFAPKESATALNDVCKMQ
ncbi:MAG: hypothetical protein Q9168_004049 [Polycauliona sp. 1 TL-2023]